MKSNIDLINACDSVPYGTVPPGSYRLTHGQHTLGHIISLVVRSLVELKETSEPVSSSFDLDHDHRTVTIRGDTFEERTANVASLANVWRSKQTFKLMRNWHDELYPAWGPGKELLFNVERTASALLGIVTYGVHMTAFVRTADGLKIWVPKRNSKKFTWGGMLDNAVAGGMASGEKPLESLVREAWEEASLPTELVRSNARACGAITYYYARDEKAGGETGLLQPECEYVYDLELGEEVELKPNDDEVEHFRLCSVPEVQDAMARGEFKPNCALVMLDFFIRHGILTPDNEPDYIEIVSRMHRKLDFPTV